MPSRSTKKSNDLEAPNWFVSALLLPLSIPLLAAIDIGRWAAAGECVRRADGGAGAGDGVGGF